MTSSRITIEDITAAMGTTRNSGRICSTGSDFQWHLSQCEVTKNKSKCEVCGESTFWKYKLCNAALHVFDPGSKRRWNGADCAMKFHSAEFFGLARSDSKLHGEVKSDWRPPQQKQINQNRYYINRLLDKHNREKIAQYDNLC